MNVGVITFPTVEAGNTPLSNLVKILAPISKDRYFIAGEVQYLYLNKKNVSNVVCIKHIQGSNILSRIFNYLITQVSISYHLLFNSKHVDVWIFFLGGDGLILPMLASKLLGKKTILCYTSSSAQILFSANDRLYLLMDKISTLNCYLSTIILLYSENLITDWHMTQFKDKILIANEHFKDYEKFHITNEYDSRKNIIGYVGRFSKEKGILTFIQSIPQVIKEKPEVQFFIIGEGQLKDEIIQFLTAHNLHSNVKLMGWVSQEELPNYLNELKLLVIPSYTEGLPNIMLEAMSCGTPVLATPVGAIPDIIKDEVTGFIMSDNSKDTIANNIIRAMSHPNINIIIKNGRALVMEKFSYDSAVNNYKKALDMITNI